MNSGRVISDLPVFFCPEPDTQSPDDDSPDEWVIRKLDGPPAAAFDCGRAEQTAFFLERAFEDQRARLSVTYCYYFKGMLAAFATICSDALPLGRRERDRTIRYQDVGAIKLAQLGVDVRFQGMGLGRLVVADVIRRARRECDDVGCRYLTLDAQPDLVRWYERQGFERNELRQERRIQEALAHGRDPARIAVSMRYDLGRIDH